MSRPTTAQWFVLWGGLAAILVGVLAYFVPDRSETYLFAPQFEWRLKGGDGRPLLDSNLQAMVELPWWVHPLAGDEVVAITVPVPPNPPAGRWFVDVLAREVGATQPGSFAVAGRETRLGTTPFAAWQRIHLDAPHRALSRRWN